jgi:hypothetical protein
MRGTQMVKKARRRAPANPGKLASFGSALDGCRFQVLGRLMGFKICVNQDPLRMPSKPGDTAERPE